MTMTKTDQTTTAQSSCCTRRLQCFCLISTILIVLSVVSLVGVLHYYVTKKQRTENLNETLIENLTSSLDMWNAPPEIQNHFKYYLAGYDYQNTAVWIVPFGTYRIQDYFEAYGEKGEELLEKYTDQFYYRLQKSRLRPRLNATDKSVISTTNSFIIICDLNDFDYGSVSTLPFLLRMAKKFAEPVSEIDYGFVLNLNWLSQFLVSVARPILGVAMAKMEMYGDDPEEYLIKIAEKIPPSQLPEIYGGITDCDESFCSYCD